MDNELSPTRQLGSFLRARREDTKPEDLGLEPGPRRKVRGLRREELAALAGLSSDYYQRLEQGRNVHPSEAILDSIADALGLEDVERRHVLQLGRAARQRPRKLRRAPERVPRNVKLLLSSITLPAVIVSRHLDVLEWNDAAADLLGDPMDVPRDQRNVLFAVLHDDGSCEGIALDYVGMLRAAVAQDPEHPRAIQVVGELSVRSSTFRQLWARNEVRESVHGANTVLHPRVGEISMEWDAYSLYGAAGPTMLVFTPQEGQEDRLQLLGVVSASGAQVATTTVRQRPSSIGSDHQTSVV